MPLLFFCFFFSWEQKCDINSCAQQKTCEWASLARKSLLACITLCASEEGICSNKFMFHERGFYLFMSPPTWSYPGQTPLQRQCWAPHYAHREAEQPARAGQRFNSRNPYFHRVNKVTQKPGVVNENRRLSQAEELGFFVFFSPLCCDCNFPSQLKIGNLSKES